MSRIKVESQRGFTLVEVLVALFVVAVALPALLSQVMGQIDGVSILREKVVAEWVAENQLAELQLERQVTDSLLDGKENGETEMAGQEWHWQVETSTTAVPGFLRYDITVSREDQSSLITLSGFIDAPEEE